MRVPQIKNKLRGSLEIKKREFKPFGETPLDRYGHFRRAYDSAQHFQIENNSPRGACIDKYSVPVMYTEDQVLDVCNIINKQLKRRNLGAPAAFKATKS